MTTAVGGGRYRLNELVATGGMGEVWRAVDTSLGRTVAVKFLHAGLAADETARRRFEVEAQNAAALHDPRIATVFDFGDDVDLARATHTAYMVMEYVAGEPMSKLLRDKPLDPSTAVRLLAQVADGLAVAHAAGIVHRDVKPANFLVTDSGVVKITDFGIARARGGAALTDTGMILGTPDYVSPEVAAGGEATAASDLYSLGVVLYEALAGVRPFTGDAPMAVALAHLRDEPPPLPVSVPAPLRDLVSECLAKDPADRPANATALAAALRGFERQRLGAATVALPHAGGATPTMPLSADRGGEPAGRPRRRWLLPAVVAGALMLTGIGIALAAALGPGTAGPTAQSARSTSSGSAGQSSAQPPHLSKVVASRYVGLPAGAARRALGGLGFRTVTTRQVAGGPRGVVESVTPTGRQPTSTTITLSVFQGPLQGSPTASPATPGKSKGPGKGGEKHHGKHEKPDKHGNGHHKGGAG